MWTFLNSGEQEWPEGTLFVQTNGDELGAVSLPVQDSVKPGQEAIIEMQMTAPQTPGAYCSYFRFIHGDN